jgi:type I restriction enzyme, S subunit
VSLVTQEPWPALRFRRALLRLEQGWSPSCHARVADGDEWGVLKAGCVNGGRFVETEHKALPAEESPLPELEVRPGDLLMSRANTRELLGSVALVPEGGRARLLLCDKLFRISVDERVFDKRFLVYAMAAAGVRAQLEAAATGSSASMQNIGQASVKDLLLPAPSVTTQRAVTDLLDRNTAAIDALIEKKERLVAAAEQRRAALIGDVVLGALSTAKRRGTGTPLGAIPEHWAVKRLMYLTAPRRPIMYGIVLPGPNVDDGVPIIKSGNCTRETLRPELLHKTTFEIEAGYARSRVAKDDIVYAIRGSVGMAALVPEDVAGANLTQDAARIAPAPEINPRWLLYAVDSAPVWAQLAAGIVGAKVKGINIRDLKRPLVPVPPRREQDEIAAYLDAEIGKLHDLEAATIRSIEALGEYRQALITAAVTGQLDIAALEAA